MYYVIAKNSENKKTYVSTFKEKREAVSNIAFRFKKKLNSLNSSKHDIKNVETCWDCDEIYEELLDQNYDQLSESKKVKIMYDLFNYEQETYARQDISWQIIFANRGPDSDLYDFVLDSRYKFECNIPESRPSNNIVLPNAARILFEDIGVEYDLHIEKGVDRSCIYKIKKNEVPAIQFNKKELIECVDEILKQHKGILYTIEDIPKAKKVVADLRKQKKYLNSERISACKPYEAIVKQTKADMDDVLARYDTVIQEIDTQIKESENVWKKEREDYIRETYEDVFLHEIPEKYLVCPIIKNLKIDSKWMLKSTSKKKIKDQMIEKRDKILSDINTLKCVAEEEFLSDVEQEYFKELDLNKAIKKNQSLREAKQKVLEAEKKRKEEELRRKEQEMKEQQETQSVEPFEFDFDPIPVPEPISRKVSSSSTPIQKNRKSSINNSSVQNYPYPLNREIHKPVMKTLNIKIRGEESVIRDIMKYIYDKKDIEILQ